MMELNYKIYALVEKITNNIRYIGLTKNPLKYRLSQHLRDRSINHKTNWIKKIGVDNIDIILIEDGIKTKEEICEREIFFISKYRYDGFNLVNTTNGGEGWNNTKFTENHKLNISLNHSDFSGSKNPMYNRSHTKESRDKISHGKKGKPNSSLTKFKSGDQLGEDNPNSTLTKHDVIMIRNLFETGNYSKKELSEMFGVKPPAIYKIIKKLTWKI